MTANMPRARRAGCEPSARTDTMSGMREPTTPCPTCAHTCADHDSWGCNECGCEEPVGFIHDPNGWCTPCWGEPSA